MHDAHAILHELVVLTGVRVETIRFGSNTKHPSQVRQVAAWLMRNVVGASYPDAGAFLARHHTTILHSCRAVDAEIRQGRGPRFELLLDLMERLR